MSTKMECANCGWLGTDDELEDTDTCPYCKCNGYLYIDEENE